MKHEKSSGMFRDIRTILACMVLAVSSACSRSAPTNAEDEIWVKMDGAFVISIGTLKSLAIGKLMLVPRPVKYVVITGDVSFTSKSVGIDVEKGGLEGSGSWLIPRHANTDQGVDLFKQVLNRSPTEFHFFEFHMERQEVFVAKDKSQIVIFTYSAK